MDKRFADKIIIKYIKKLYGFALSKTSNIEKAEELASRITLEVYAALLERNNIQNVNSYIYRVAQNVYARFIDNSKKSMHLSLDNFIIPSADDFTEKVIKSETYKLLRREIAYLSKTQRDIVISHYFDRLKLAGIAERLNIPVGTVKWHLYGAKNSLKEGMTLMRNAGNLGIQPIKLIRMGHCGNPGSKGDTNDFLQKRLTQNVAYAAYYKAKTINEIAEELGVSPLFIEDEVSILEEYGFMDRLAGNRYLTNIYINHPTKEFVEKEHQIYNKYAKIICEKYVPLVVKSLEDYDREEIYVPCDDMNLLLWSAVTYACNTNLYFDKGINLNQFYVKRKDGGDYIALANVDTNFDLSFDPKKYNACGDMTRGSDKYPIYSWQLNTYYDGREGGWRNNRNTDYEYLYEFLSGKLKKEESQIDKFKRLYDKGYITDENGTELVNIIVVKNRKDEQTTKRFCQMLPQLTDKLKVISDEFDREVFEIRKSRFPAHMQELCRAWTTNCFTGTETITRVLEQLLERGVLKLPNEEQKKGLLTLMFCDVLPKIK